jgi:hypothetical protein
MTFFNVQICLHINYIIYIHLYMLLIVYGTIISCEIICNFVLGVVHVPFKLSMKTFIKIQQSIDVLVNSEKRKSENVMSMGNHFILQNSNPPPIPTQGRLIRNGIHYNTNARSNHIDLAQSLCERMPWHQGITLLEPREPDEVWGVMPKH